MNPVYKAWENMKQRCLNPSHPRFKDYGAKGITVCTRWLSFENFEQDMGIRPINGILDRIDNNQGYYPGNCRWLTSYHESNQNKGTPVINKSGTKGVCFVRRRNKWMAYGTINDKKRWLGQYETKELAIQARQLWEAGPW